ncbi:unnamed protein product [Microthlaspi erraticum]|uniref:Uncharacterized protein n=1 Tax=Microthlaspi erraticum TaxID=1685480 RepID=A0A6D2JJ48_9BRAS|nr:unnamed protein product [Microthlaspi erraticum]
MIKLVKTGQCIHFIRVPQSPRPSSRTDPESNVPRSSVLSSTAPREQKATHRGRAAQPCTTADPSVRPGRLRPATGQDSSAKSSIRPTRRPNTKTLGHDRSDRADSRHDPMTGRPSRPTVRTVRSTRSPF